MRRSRWFASGHPNKTAVRAWKAAVADSFDTCTFFAAAFTFATVAAFAFAASLAARSQIV
jgi:hypothetical protein